LADNSGFHGSTRALAKVNPLSGEANRTATNVLPLPNREMIEMRSKSLFGALLSLLLLASAAVDSLAAGDPYDGGRFLYNGESAVPVGEFLDVLIYNQNSESIQDFFGREGKNFFPGDSRVVTVRLVNHSARRATFYLMAAARTVHGYAPGQGGFPDNNYLSDSFDNGAGKSTNVEPFFPGKKAGADSLLEAMHITMSQITTGGISTRFFEGSLGGAPDTAGETGPYSTTWLQLGSLATDETRIIEVKLDLALAYGNELNDALASVDWTFYATEDNSSPGTSRQTRRPPVDEVSDTVSPDNDISEPLPPLESMTEEPTEDPGGNTEEDITIIVPLDSLPKTGGLMNFSTVAAFAVLLILILLFIIIIKERKIRRQPAEESNEGRRL
jgi:hypothetical protein